jgi:hypothetical protein
MNRVTIGVGDGLSFSIWTLLGNMEGVPLKERELLEMGASVGGPLGTWGGGYIYWEI